MRGDTQLEPRGAPDLARMRRDRGRRLREEMARQEVDALLLLGRSNVNYATGAASLNADAGRIHLQPCVALVTRDDPAAHLFTPYPEGAPPELAADHLHEPLCPELGSGVREMARVLRTLLGSEAAVRLGIDESSAAMHTALPGLLPRTRFADASPVTTVARVCKTADEIECVRFAQHVNEVAMRDVQAALRPGVRQCDLSALFLRRIFDLGATGNVVNPIWEVVPPRVAAGPFTLTGEVVFPLVSTDRVLGEGDVVWVDTGISYQGYASDFGRTWIASDAPRPSARQREQFARWQEVVERVLGAVRPGASGADLTAAALAGAGHAPALSAGPGSTRPWLTHLYLAHGVGLDSAEAPLVGTDLGDEFDRSIVLAPGMILVLEPVIWEEGHAGYRGEEIVAVTETGYEKLSDYPYGPYE